MKYSKPTTPLTQQAAEAIDRSGVIPEAVETERAVIGAVLIENSPTTQSAVLMLSPEMFYEPAHSMIFEAIKQLEAEGKRIDLLTVSTRLKENGRLRTVGGTAYLTELTMATASGAHLEDHCRILIETHIARQVLQAAYASIRQVLSGETDIAATIDGLTERLEQAQLSALVGSNRKHIAQVVAESIELAKKREERVRKGITTGVTTGLSGIDQLTGGFQAGELIVVAARPAMGKTAVMIHLMLQAARAGVPVCAYSLEMTNASLGNRLLVAESGGTVSADHLKRGLLMPSEWDQTKAAQERLSKLPIYTDDRSGVSIQYIATHSRMMHRRGQCGIIFIDYLQLMDTRTTDKGRNREQEVAQTSKAAKVLAKELGVPVVLLAQLNRAVEGRGAKEPMLSDIRESGAVEQDADIVMFIHRPEYYEKNKEFITARLSDGRNYDLPIKGLGKLIIAKNREGATGNVKFSYNDSLTVLTDFDETSYTQPTATYNEGGKRPVSSGSIHYVPEAIEPNEDLPF